MNKTVGICMALGAGIGVFIGTPWIAIGAGIGLVIGTAVHKNSNEENKE